MSQAATAPTSDAAPATAPTTTTDASTPKGAPSATPDSTPGTSDTKDAASTSTPSKRPRVSVPLSELTRLEREARAKMQEAEALKAKLGPLETLLSKKDVAGLTKMLGEQGISLEDLVTGLADQHAGAAERTPEQVAEAIVKRELEAAEKRRQDEARAAEEARIAETHAKFRAHLQREAETNPDAYEMVNATPGAVEEAYILIAHASGVKISDDDPWEPPDGFEPRWIEPKEALQMVESHLRGRLKGRKATRHVLAEELGVAPEELEQVLAQIAAKKAAKQGKTEPSAKSGNAPSLNNRNASGVPAVDTEDPEDLDDRARTKRAFRVALAAG